MDKKVTIASQLRYAISQTNFIVDNIVLPKKIERDLTPLLIQFATCFCHYTITNHDTTTPLSELDAVKI